MSGELASLLTFAEVGILFGITEAAVRFHAHSGVVKTAGSGSERRVVAASLPVTTTDSSGRAAYSVEEAASRGGLSVAAMQKRIARGGVPVVRLGYRVFIPHGEHLEMQLRMTA